MSAIVDNRMTVPYAFKDLATPSRYKAYYGGRGGAKSHTFAQDLVVRGSKRPLRILCCREIQNSISTSVKQLLDDKAIAAGLMGNFYSSSQYVLSGQNGTEFLFAGLRTNPDSIKSMEGIDIVWVEEANTVSQRSLQLLIPTIRRDDSEIWFSWNRRHKTDPVDKMFLGPDGPPPRSIVKRVNWADNPWFPDVLREEMEWDKSRDRDKWLHVWEGEPIIRSDAKVFQNWIVDDIDEHMPEGCIPRLGADWGFAVDPTVLVECYVWDRTLYFRSEAYKLKCEIDDTPALFAGTDDRDEPRWKNRNTHPGLASVRAGHRIVADSARPETISYMKKRGFNITKARKGSGSIEDGIEFMKSYDIVVHPSCQHIIDEMTYYAYKEDTLTGEVISVLADKNNHTIDAARYALEGVRRSKRGRISTVGPELISLDYG